MNSNRESAIVVGGGLNALGVVRSLGSGGVPVTAVAAGTGFVAMESRYARKRVVSPVEGPGFLATLEALARASSGKPAITTRFPILFSMTKTYSRTWIYVWNRVWQVKALKGCFRQLPWRLTRKRRCAGRK